jgi:nitroreductase
MPTEMKLYEALRGRRSIGRMHNTPVAKEVIEQILEAGNWAPSHHATEPWRFFVMTEDGRHILGDAYADIAALSAQVDSEELTSFRAKHSAKAFRAPVIIAVSVQPSSEKHVNRMEEYAAAHAAVQNMMLAAHALGLGSIWRSGEPMYHSRMKQAFGLQEEEELVALLYLGIADMPVLEGKRRPYQEKTKWLNTKNVDLIRYL